MSERARRQTTEGTGIPAKSTAVGPTDAETDSAALRSYLHAIDETLGCHLTEDAVEDRLAQLKRAVSARSELREEDWARLLGPLVEYAYQGIRCWLAVLVLSGAMNAGPESFGRPLSGLSESEIDQLAEEIVTRAITSFREEMATIRRWLPDGRPDMNKLIMLECALQLPDTLRNWHSNQRSLDDPLEEAMSSAPDTDGYALFRLLYMLFRDDRDGTVHRLRDIGYDEIEVDEIVDATLEVFDFAATRLASGTDAESVPGDALERGSW